MRCGVEVAGYADSGEGEGEVVGGGVLCTKCVRTCGCEKVGRGSVLGGALSITGEGGGEEPVGGPTHF
eukprot:3802330-Pleurochrysis_carterae.AAC.1